MIAYILANNSKKFDILGLTSISLAYTVNNVTDILIRFLDYMDYEDKVYKGENHPLIRQTQPETFYHDIKLIFLHQKKQEKK